MSGEYTIDPPVEPMLAKLADELPSGGGFLYEPKWDGFRAVVFRRGSSLFIQSRDLRPLDRYFPELHEALLAGLPPDIVLDGEVVIATSGGLDFDAVMHTNVRAPMQLIPALAPALIAARGKLAVISSRMGSVSLMGSTSNWLYRASKAALNAALKAASLELGAQGVVCIAFHPGWVRTDMGGGSADIDVRTSVAGMRRVLTAANDSSNGKFINYNGEHIAW